MTALEYLGTLPWLAVVKVDGDEVTLAVSLLSEELSEKLKIFLGDTVVLEIPISVLSAYEELPTEDTPRSLSSGFLPGYPFNESKRPLGLVNCSPYSK